MTEPIVEACRRYVGIETEFEFACDPVERGSVRRFAQAVMDEDPMFWSEAPGGKFGGPVAPPLFPAHIFRRSFGTDDPLSANAGEPDYDGLSLNALQGLPPIEPLRHYALLNGGIEVEFFRYARHGERVQSKSRYADVTAKPTDKGLMVIVVIEAEYRTGEGALLLRIRRSQLRRDPGTA